MDRAARPAATPPLPLLITGVAGVPGYNALRYLRARYPGRVVGIRQQQTRRPNGPDVVACNIEDRPGLARLFERHRFAAVLDCAGSCALKTCELDPDLAWTINVDGAENLLSQTVPRGVRLVRLSADLVFSGDGLGGYTEDHPTDPVTMYGKTMVAAEQAILAHDPSACVLRISLPMGTSPSGHAGAIDWIASRFRKSRPATLFFDEIRTPTYADCLNALYEVLLAGPDRGLFHAGGPRPLSLYQIAQIVNRVGGYDPDCLMGIFRRQAAPLPPRAGNVTLDSGKLARTLGYVPFDPWPLDESLVPLDADWHRRRAPGEPGSPEWLHRVLCVNPARRIGSRAEKP